MLGMFFSGFIFAREKKGREKGDCEAAENCERKISVSL